MPSRGNGIPRTVLVESRLFDRVPKGGQTGNTLRGMRGRHLTTLFSGIVVILVLTGCAGTGSEPFQLRLMPAPDVYDDGRIDPFIEGDTDNRDREIGILYATDRLPAAEDDRRYRYYTREWGYVVRVGEANVSFGSDDGTSWEEARRMSLLKERPEDIPLSVKSVEEYGPFLPTVRPFDENVEMTEAPGKRLIEEIDARLAVTRGKDVYIYVPGYRVGFEYPALVAAELWHYLGYNGAFVTYSWPTSTARLAYIPDVESALSSARGLRILITHIAEHSQAERIHLIGYSAGARVVSRAVADLGMFAYGLDEREIRRKVKLGHVILVGSDVERAQLAGYFLDGALEILDDLTIYASGTDKALGVARLLLRRYRSGQIEDVEDLGPRAREFFDNTEKLILIDATGTVGSDSGNGHAYFRSSPWVSSDILMTLMRNLPPGERGLVRRTDLPVWAFPDDYSERLRDAVESDHGKHGQQ